MKRKTILLIAVTSLLLIIPSIVVLPRNTLADEEDYWLKAVGTISFITLEFGMFEFVVYTGETFELYDLFGVKEVVSPQIYELLINHPDEGYPAYVEGLVKPDMLTCHMHGYPTDVVKIVVFIHDNFDYNSPTESVEKISFKSIINYPPNIV
jgi:hypothetical protein